MHDTLSDSREQLHTLIDTALDAVVGMDAEGVITIWNGQAEKILGWTRKEAVGRVLSDTIIPLQFREAHVQGLRRFMLSGHGPILNTRVELRALHRDGHEFPIELAIAPVRMDDGYEFCAYIRDISARQRAQRDERMRGQVLGLLAHGAPLPEILNALVLAVEEGCLGALAAILMLDGEGRHLQIGAAPSLKEFYKHMPNGVEIAPGLGGAANYLSERAMVPNIQREPGWGPYRAPAADAGLVSCWLEPIQGASGQLLGSLASYHRDTCNPTRDQLELVAHAAALAGIAIERRCAEEKLQLAALVYQHSGEAMMVTDLNNCIVAINPAYTQLTGYAADEVIGKHYRLMNSGRQDKDFYRDLWKVLRASGRWQGEMWGRRKNGDEFAGWLGVNAIAGEDGLPHHYVSFFADITEKKRTDEVIWKQANFDLLTGLPNRRLFRERLDIALKKADRAARGVALFFIDLDHFQEVNDALGHDIGDALLIEAARRIGAGVRQSDAVAHLGGDEFTVIMSELEGVAKVEQSAQRLLDRLQEPYHVGSEVVYLSASIGITLYPTDADSSDGMLKNADQAMSVAKREGRNRFCHYVSSMQEEVQTRLRLSGDLRNALANGQLQVHFQPIVNLSDGRIRKAEALLRWTHPQRGAISPAEFIPLAEESGLINEIGDWVFKESAGWAQRWSALLGWPFEVSVNKSPVQFLNQEKYAAWPGYLKQIGLPGECITVEITEGLLLNPAANVQQQLREYRDAGIRVSIDDFGTGYSSMSYLKKFHIDYLKIDQSFVRDMATDAGDRAIAEAIIAMAHKLGLKVIAEGIETEDQRALLAEAGCDFGQGYLFSRAVPPERFEALLNEGYPPGVELRSSS